MFIFFCRRYSVHCDSWAECAVRSEGDQLWIAPSGHHVPKVNTKDFLVLKFQTVQQDFFFDIFFKYLISFQPFYI